MVLSQLDRSLEHREDTRPTLNDMGNKSDLRRCANSIIFIYRRIYYSCVDTTDIAEATQNETELIIVKNAYGEAGIAAAAFDRERVTFCGSGVAPQDI